jgi:hypothetical protein
VVQVLIFGLALLAGYGFLGGLYLLVRVLVLFGAGEHKKVAVALRLAA